MTCIRASHVGVRYNRRQSPRDTIAAVRVELMNPSQDPASSAPATPHRATRQKSGPAFEDLCRLYDSYLVKASKARHELLIRYSPKSLHAWRVSLRRITATLDQVCEAVSDEPPTAVVEQLKSYRNATGLSRDLDILLDETLPAYQSAKPKAPLPGPDELQKLESERERLHNEALQRVHEADLPSAQRAFEAWHRQQSVSDSELHQIAAELIEYRFQQLRKRGERLGEGRKPLHQARTATKRLRYTMELFEPIFTKEAIAPWLLELADLQSHLGESHDRMTARMLFKGILAESAADPAIKGFRKWCRRTAQSSATKAAAGLEKLLRLEHYWRHPAAGQA